MNLSETFIRRPIATSLIMAGIAMFGIIGYRSLPVSEMPAVDYPTINVGASLPGADPATMSSAVATVLERQFTGIAGLDSMTSRSSTGSTNVTLQFSLDRNIDSAAVDVQVAIAAVTPLLPAGMPAPPSFRKNNPTDQPIAFMSLLSDTLPLSKLDDYAETLIAPRISMTNGVAQVQVGGQQKYAVRVQVDPDKLAASQVGLNDVSAALSQWNVNSPMGSLYGPRTAYNIYANGQLMNAQQFRHLVVAQRNGRPIHLEDVANVIDSVQDDKNATWVYHQGDQGARAITLIVFRQPGTNTLEVTDRVKALVPLFNQQLPPSAHLQVRGDRSHGIRAAFRDIQITMLITIVLVVGVIFVFLRNLWGAAIPSLALPFSLLGACSVMAALHFSLDNMSMMALVLCIGFVVDDAIVMLENIMRHVEMGEPPFEAALKGSKEIGFTILSMTISLAAVFIPILFMGGILGRLFREFAVTITVAILFSGMVSIMFTPMLCSRFLKVREPGRHNRVYRLTESMFNAMLRFYAWTLRAVLGVRPVMAVVFFAVIGLTLFLFKVVPKGFIPDADTDSLNMNIQAAEGTSYYKMLDYQQQVANILRQDKNFDYLMVSVGGGYGPNSGNSANVNMFLLPRDQRQFSTSQIMNQVRPRISRFPGFRAIMRIPPAINIGTRGSNASYELTVQSSDTEALNREARRLEAAVARETDIIADVNTDLQARSPRVNLIVDRDRAASLGLDITSIENALYSAYGPRWSSTIYGSQAQYEVLLEIQQKYQAFTDYLSKIYFRTNKGALIPLNEVVKLKPDVMPQTINHTGTLPSVTISFNLRQGISLGQAVDRLGEVAKRTLPDNMSVHFTGTAAVFQSSLRNLNLLLIVALGVVYIVLGVLYESYIHPFTILSGLPSAGVGALLTLMLFKVDLNIYSFVGLILLVGLVKKNAIMQIDFALEAERKEGKTPVEAIYQGCLIRFRPIMMTTMAALLGSVPLALGFGSGGEARRPMGLAVVGGLMLSQLMTLYLTPVVYTYMASLLNWWRRRRAPAVQPQPVAGFAD
ncbi:MAG TPA: efflux RND transporter permease subunit [Bryobacteraceae bacterium]|nr:efflux RND transporter permease subunit [Bryobacteraceae bacterium]